MVYPKKNKNASKQGPQQGTTEGRVDATILRIKEEFTAYHKWYAIRISAVVLPLMIAEMGLAVWWVLCDNHSTVSVLTFLVVLIVWFSTLALQVPIHNRLKNGKDTRLIRRLVATNWIRTAGWSVKAGAVSIYTIRTIF